MRGTVYVIRNTVTHRVYVGGTVQQPSIRFQAHLTAMKQPTSEFYADYMAYGRKSFRLVWWQLVDDVGETEKRLIARMPRRYNRSDKRMVRTSNWLRQACATRSDNFTEMRTAERLRTNPVMSAAGDERGWLVLGRRGWCWLCDGSQATVDEMRRFVPGCSAAIPRMDEQT